MATSELPSALGKQTLQTWRLPSETLTLLKHESNAKVAPPLGDAHSITSLHMRPLRRRVKMRSDDMLCKIISLS